MSGASPGETTQTWHSGFYYCASCAAQLQVGLCFALFAHLRDQRRRRRKTPRIRQRGHVLYICNELAARIVMTVEEMALFIAFYRNLHIFFVANLFQKNCTILITLYTPCTPFCRTLFRLALQVYNNGLIHE